MLYKRLRRHPLQELYETSTIRSPKTSGKPGFRFIRPRRQLPMTSIDMAGASITVLRLDDELVHLDYPVATPRPHSGAQA